MAYFYPFLWGGLILYNRMCLNSFLGDGEGEHSWESCNAGIVGMLPYLYFSRDKKIGKELVRKEGRKKKVEDD